MKQEVYDIVIIGSGIAGYSAAIYCERLNLKSIVIGKEIGGTLAKVDWIENYPGFKKISGAELVNKVIEQAKEYGAETYNGEVIEILKEKEMFIVKTRKKDFSSKAILICTGSERRKLKIPGEKEFEGRGVHYCGMCDGPMYKEKIVAIAGGGDAALNEALLLARFAKKVYLITRGDLKAEHVNKEKLAKEKKIEILTNTKIKEIKGNKSVESLTVEKAGKETVIKTDGIFVEIGNIPMSSLTKGLGVKTNQFGELIIDKESKTNVKSVYAAGDVTDSKFKQAITGVGEAIKAVYSIYDSIEKEK